jgi:sensor histidine kinase YesM
MKMKSEFIIVKNKKSRILLFWYLQIIGWGLLSLISMTSKLVYVESLSKTYIIVEALIFFSGIVLFSSLYRWYIKPRLNFQHIKFIMVLRIILAYLITIILTTTYIILLDFLAYKTFIEGPWEERTKAAIFTVINIAIFLFFWTMSYVAIKMYFFYQDNKLEQARLATTVKESQLNTLKGQINPHFMFNSLNNIRGLMLEDVDKSREMLTRLSDMLRYSLTKNNIDTIQLKEELEMIENYILLSKIQLEGRLTFETDIATQTLEAKIPPMIVQMLIENAVKHGISELKNGGVIKLITKTKGDDLFIEVHNTGELSDKKSSTKIGHKNIEQRLSLLYAERASFSLKEVNNEVIAKIKIPLS